MGKEGAELKGDEQGQWIHGTMAPFSVHYKQRWKGPIGQDTTRRQGGIASIMRVQLQNVTCLSIGDHATNAKRSALA